MTKLQGPKVTFAVGAAEKDAGPTPQEVESMLQLLGDFGRTKLSLTSLMLRPVWHDTLIATLQGAGLNTEDAESPEQAHWIYLFYRLGRLFQQRAMDESGAASINMRCLAKQFGVPLSTGTRIADQMVQRGVLERHSDAHDRRVVLLRLSVSGQEAMNLIDGSIRERMTAILQNFNAEERQQILSLGSRLFQIWTASLCENILPPTEELKPETSKPKSGAKTRQTHTKKEQNTP